MGATLSTLISIATEIYGGSSGAAAYGVIDSEWVKSTEFQNLLVLSDQSVARLICLIKDLPARKTFLTGTQNGIANGAQLNTVAGPVETIQLVVSGGRWAGTHRGAPPRGQDLGSQLAELSIENRNATSNPEIAPHCVQEGATLYHNAAGLVLGGASSVSVNATYPVIPTLSYSITETVCSPEFAEVIVLDAIAVKFGQDGHRLEAAGFYARRSDTLKAMGVAA